MRRINLLFLAVLLLPIHLWGKWGKDGFERYGDVVQFLPLLMVGYSLYEGDTEGIKEQTIGSLLTFGITAGTKEVFEAIAKKNPQKAKISQRPNHGRYNGFPSGHTSFAFSAVGFAQKRYGYYLSIPMALLASSVGVSRVHAKRHTRTQVVAGAVLGTLTSYLVSSEYPALSKMSLYHTPAADGSINYHMAWRISF